MPIWKRSRAAIAFAALLLWSSLANAADSPDATAAAIKSVLAVGQNGEGAVAAKAAMKTLSAADASELGALYQAFEGANPLAANYLRGAIETISDRTVQGDGKLPIMDLKAIVEDRKRDPRSRSLAFEWLQRGDAKLAESLVPGMISDPSPDLRRLAVERLIGLAGKSLEKEESIQRYEEALAGAVDDDQVKTIVENLKKHGKTVDLQKHFGFLPQWSIIGPFDNKEGKGFAAVYPPEEKVDFKATYKGQLGDVEWTPITTKDDYGILDIAKDVKPYKGAVMYLGTTFVSERPQSVELRLGTPNAWKIWVNGKFQFGREEYHRGMALDQYRVPVELAAGKNVILVKLCQNEQDQDWAQRYQLQLRVCDPSGSAVRPADAVALKDR